MDEEDLLLDYVLCFVTLEVVKKSVNRMTARFLEDTARYQGSTCSDSESSVWSVSQPTQATCLASYIIYKYVLLELRRFHKDGNRRL